jgi:2,4-dienoyl-CoA reductase
MFMRVYALARTTWRAPRRFLSAAIPAELSARFEAAAASPSLSPSSPSEHLLRAYALFKQARVGDAGGSRPGLFDPSGRAKFDAWEKLRGMSREAAMAAYVAEFGGAAATPAPPAPAPGGRGAFAKRAAGGAPSLPAGAFAGKLAFVTGGGTGLGKAMATRFLQLGAAVAISSRKGDVLEAAARDMRAAVPGGVVVPFAADVRDPAAVAAALDAAAAATGLGAPDFVVNNAAGNFISPYERLSPNAVKSILDIVLAGTALVTLEAGKRMIAGGKGGVFLNITTTYAPEGSGWVAPSAMAKAGVHALTRSLAVEWGRHGIRCLGIAPGPIETEGAFSRLDPTGQFKAMSIQRLPAKRLGEPEELANLAAFLCSDYAAWMTGTVVTFDGGETAALCAFARSTRQAPFCSRARRLTRTT